MKSRGPTWTKLGLAAVVAALAVIMIAGAGASGAGLPAWEPDPDALGTISLYDATGAQVTGGDLSHRPAVFYAVASGPGRAGDDRAQLRAATPQPGVLPVLWTTDPLSGTSPYPNPLAPANIANLSLPVATATAVDLSLAEHIFLYPNTSTTAGYSGLYQLRLYTSGPGQGAGNKYYRVDIEVTVLGTDANGLVTGVWNVVYPAVPTTSNGGTGSSTTASPSATASPTASATPTPSATASPSPNASPSASPSASASPSPTPIVSTSAPPSSPPAASATQTTRPAPAGGGADPAATDASVAPVASTSPSVTVPIGPPLPATGIGGPLSLSGAAANLVSLGGLGVVVALAIAASATAVVRRRRDDDFWSRYEE